MTRHKVIKLGLGTGIAVALALWATSLRNPSDGSAERGQPLVSGLHAALNDVTQLRVVEAGNKTAVTLQRADQGWRVAERNGYPADIAKVRETLIKFANSKMLEAKTANPERHAVLGVEDVAKADAKGMRIEIDGKVPAKLVVGTYNTQSNGTFVRRNDEAQAWLAQDSLVLDRQAANWLAKDLLDIPSDRIMSVEISRGGQSFSISKTSPEQDAYVIDNMPSGRELVSPYEPNGLASVPSGLRFDDVASAEAAVPDPASLIKATYRTFDGMIIEVTAFASEGKNYATLKASLDDARAALGARAAQLNAVADHKADSEVASEATDAKPADGADEAVAAPLAVTDPSADIAQRRKAIEAEVAKLNERFSGWIYVLPAFKYANINKRLEDLLKPKG